LGSRAPSEYRPVHLACASLGALVFVVLNSRWFVAQMQAFRPLRPEPAEETPDV
jgi:hypothetical protein